MSKIEISNAREAFPGQNLFPADQSNRLLAAMITLEDREPSQTSLLYEQGKSVTGSLNSRGLEIATVLAKIEGCVLLAEETARIRRTELSEKETYQILGKSSLEYKEIPLITRSYLERRKILINQLAQK